MTKDPASLRKAISRVLIRDIAKLAIGKHPTHSTKILFPGAFNPLHVGHLKIATLAFEKFGAPVEFELSVTNVDKPALTLDETIGRVSQFSSEQTVWITRATTFQEKVRLFPKARVLVGADTIMRIADPKYYRDSIDQRDRALDRLQKSGCEFVVFGRLIRNRYCTLDQLELPKPLAAICSPVSQDEFRYDLSSTELRKNGRLEDIH